MHNIGTLSPLLINVKLWGSSLLVLSFSFPCFLGLFPWHFADLLTLRLHRNPNTTVIPRLARDY